METALATPFSERLQRMAADRLARMAEAPGCDTHPGEKVGFCTPCRDAVVADDRARRHAYEVGTANRRCDQEFPVRYRNAVADLPEVLAWVEGFLKRERGDEAEGLLLLGKTGTGKTYQAYGALRAAVTEARHDEETDSWSTPRWRAMTMADLNAEMRPGGDRDPEATLKLNRSVELFVLDDLGAARSSEWVEDHLYRLINARYEAMLPTIFTTNLDPSALRDAVGDRIASRLVECCRRVVLAGVDRRRTPKES
jgi:DNA replication protein DnaC